MSAAASIELPARYDTACAYCADGKVIVRARGKAACEKCLTALEEAGIFEPNSPTLRAVVRAELGLGPRDYPEPLHERAAAIESGGKEKT